jgi:hypothetical protein
MFCQPTDVLGMLRLLVQRARSRLATPLGGWIFLGDGDTATVHSTTASSNWSGSLQIARTMDIGMGW